MVKLQQINGRSFLNIPKEYVKWKKWKKGTEVVIGFNERNNLEIAEVVNENKNVNENVNENENVNVNENVNEK